MILVKVYDKYINKLIKEFKLNAKPERFSIGDYIVCNKRQGTSVVTENFRIRAIRHEIAFEGGYEEDVATHKKITIEVNSI